MPKGGGVYKVGAPYRINGKRYVPRKVDHYDVRGVASWYGELFHGRRTANGEIYDMEALSAAHPTLPLPSYVRVTNLRNGRSLVVRVNDRGPFARNREIDLSWAIASLLEMRGAGTAPVRVQYLGPAPLDGDDSYERSVLASQPWAGRRVAYASSPGKAIGYRQAAATYDQSVTRSKKRAVIAVNESAGQQTARAVQPSLPLPVSRIAALGVEANRGARRNYQEDKPTSERPQAVAFMQAPSPRIERAAALEASEPAPRPSSGAKPSPSRPSTFYVEAGLFAKKPLAERLAEILKEIAPTSVAAVTVGSQPVHRVWLGPFAHDSEAQAAAERIRQAGLTSARVERVRDG